METLVDYLWGAGFGVIGVILGMIYGKIFYGRVD